MMIHLLAQLLDRVAYAVAKLERDKFLPQGKIPYFRYAVTDEAMSGLAWVH